MRLKNYIKKIKENPDKYIKKAQIEINKASEKRNQIKKERAVGMEYSDRQKYKKKN